MRSTLEEYVRRYADFAVVSHAEGITEVRFHWEGQEAHFNRRMHQGIPDLFADLATDAQTRVVILTGTGRLFFGIPARHRRSSYVPLTPSSYAPLMSEAWRLIWSLLEIEVPVIAAVNGSAPTHAEIPVACDIVVAADDAGFSDAFHFVNGIIPGDGAQVIWAELLGPIRSSYFLLTGRTIDSREAEALGFVHEVLPPALVLPRARELARRLCRHSDVVLRNKRSLSTARLKKAVLMDLPLGLAVEGLGNINSYPVAD